MIKHNYFVTAFIASAILVCTTVKADESRAELIKHIANENWQQVEEYFEDNGEWKYGQYQIEFAPQCWKSVEDTKKAVEQEIRKFESDLRLCKDKSNTKVSGRAKCLRNVRVATDFCGRGGRSLVCQDDLCKARDFSFLPTRLHKTFDEDYMAAVEYDHQADRSAAIAKEKENNAKEEYQDSKNPLCAFYYWLPEIKGVAMNDKLAGIVAKKAGVGVKDVHEAIAQGQRWVDYAFDESPFQRKPVALPKYFYGTLHPNDLTPDQLEQHFGKAHRTNMTLQMIPNRISVRFGGLKGKPPCGNVLIKYKRAYAKDGVLIIEGAKLFPSLRGQ